MWTSSNLWPERIRIPFQSWFNRLSSRRFIFNVVETIYTVATITVSARCKTFTIPDQKKTLYSVQFTMNKSTKKQRVLSSNGMMRDLQLQAPWVFTVTLFLLLRGSISSFPSRPWHRIRRFGPPAITKTSVNSRNSNLALFTMKIKMSISIIFSNQCKDLCFNPQIWLQQHRNTSLSTSQKFKFLNKRETYGCLIGTWRMMPWDCGGGGIGVATVGGAWLVIIGRVTVTIGEGIDAAAIEEAWLECECSTSEEPPVKSSCLADFIDSCVTSSVFGGNLSPSSPSPISKKFEFLRRNPEIFPIFQTRNLKKKTKIYNQFEKHTKISRSESALNPVSTKTQKPNLLKLKTGFWNSNFWSRLIEIDRWN